MADARDSLIVAQNAATAAANIVTAEIAAGTHSPDGSLDIERFELIRKAIAEGSLEFAQGAAVAGVVAAFPGAAPVAAPVPLAVPAPVGAPPVPTVPQAPPVPVQAAVAPAAAVACKKCGGPTVDKTADNARKRAGGFKLGPDYECPQKCKGGNTWPGDYDAHKARPAEPRR